MSDAAASAAASAVASIAASSTSSFATAAAASFAAAAASATAFACSSWRRPFSSWWLFAKLRTWTYASATAALIARRPSRICVSEATIWSWLRRSFHTTLSGRQGLVEGAVVLDLFDERPGIVSPSLPKVK